MLCQQQLLLFRVVRDPVLDDFLAQVHTNTVAQAGPESRSPWFSGALPGKQTGFIGAIMTKAWRVSVPGQLVTEDRLSAPGKTSHPPLRPPQALREPFSCSYEECMGPGATQLYLPTDAPPPYSLIDTSHSSGGYQQGQSGLHTISMDALPPYEAVCGAPPSLLPLPGPEPEPSSFQGSPAPNGDLVSSPERIV